MHETTTLSDGVRGNSQTSSRKVTAIGFTGWEITATEFTYEAPIPRGDCRQFWDPSSH